VRHKLEARVKLLNGSWDAAAGVFDLIVSNPPYIPAGDLVRLPPDVRKYEPEAALDGGLDGVSAYRALAPVLRTALKPEGVAALEIGIVQSHIVRDIMEGAGFRAPKIMPDLAGIPRCVVLRRL
jgi:release factor glutamine methyltransferase